MNPITLCLTESCSSLSPSTLFPPKPQQPKSLRQHNHSPTTILSQLQPPLERNLVSRRDLFLLISLGSFLPSPPASAFDFGISGPKDWLKEQKKKTSKYLLAPIDASREILQSAFLLLTGKESDYESNDLEEVQNMFKSAARDCVLEDRNSFVEFQAKTGVEVCTFTLIVKNASSLLDKKDPVKLEAEAMLNDLIRSFGTLNYVANGADIQLGSNRKEVANAVMDVISSLDKFEQGIKNILEKDLIPPFYGPILSGDPDASTRYNLQHGVPSSGFVWTVLGMPLSLLNRFNGSRVSPKCASGSPICDSLTSENPIDGNS
ncbi:hypothetical protein V2J09_007223 [Rumex salicifolius]